LHFAAASGEVEVVSLLLLNGADPMICDGEGYLPLYSALSQGHYPIVARLMSEYANPASLIIVRPTRSTALHITYRFASAIGALYLLKKGADVNAIDSNAKTPLHEVLSQDCTDLESEIIKTIDCLFQYGSTIGLNVQSDETTVAMGRNHFSSRVRQMFHQPHSSDDPARIDLLPASRVTEAQIRLSSG
jgi:ankyrin repeat protein